ncbi:MAG: outer membrane protein assembly factor BamD [Opitutaceae bacterium]|nr:outer membrane protein assembly factor BamD [Cytophagales bacterium]
MKGLYITLFGKIYSQLATHNSKLWVVLLLSTTTLPAQKIDHKKNYEAAKTELKNKNYAKAMDLFKKASNEHPENLNRINATYFYGYCAYQQKQYWSANHYLTKLIEKYPTWNKISEAYYLMSVMSFEKREYTNGLLWTQRIVSKYLKKDVENLKWNYLNFPSLKDTVIELNRQNCKDTTLATILYNLVKDEGGWRNKKYAKRLIEDYGINTEPVTVPVSVVIKAPAPKDTLRIAVMLPFNLKENLRDNEIKSNMYLFDLYNGLRFATDSMRKSGAKIRLVAYDYGKDSVDFIRFIEKPELAGYDVMIGPLQNSVAQATNRFAQTTNTLVVNPLSTNLKFTEGSNKVCLFKTSFETQAKQAAYFSASHFNPKKALIITSKNARDSVVAATFKINYDSAGGKTIGKLSLTASTLGKMDNFFSKKTLDSTGVIFVSTKDQYLGVSIVRKLTELDKAIPMLVSADWIEFQSMNFDQMKKQNLYFMGSDYMNLEGDTIASISRSLIKKTNSIPSVYTFTGYELIYQLTRLTKTDVDFFSQPEIKNINPQQGFLFKGLDYKKGKDNTLFTIQRFTDAGFEEVK